MDLTVHLSLDALQSLFALWCLCMLAAAVRVGLAAGDWVCDRFEERE